MVMRKFIEFSQVNKSYQSGEIKTRVLKDVSFSVDEGEFVVLLGKSGSGKSTILNILGGMDRASGGTVFAAGKDITACDDKAIAAYRRDKIGFVFQSYNLISGLTALENVELGAEVCKNHLNPAKMLASVGLSKKKNSFPTQMSGGEQQRAAIARALAKNPLILLCDEPTGALDDANGKMILELLEKVNASMRKTILIITHNASIAPMADKVIRVADGRIEGVMFNENKISVKELGD